MDEQVKERIKYYTEWLRTLLIIILADISGTISLMTRVDKTPIELVFTIFGIFSIFILVIAIIWISYSIHKKIQKIIL